MTDMPTMLNVLKVVVESLRLETARLSRSIFVRLSMNDDAAKLLLFVGAEEDEDEEDDDDDVAALATKTTEPMSAQNRCLPPL
jgi:hypothetical protein